MFSSMHICYAQRCTAIILTGKLSNALSPYRVFVDSFITFHLLFISHYKYSYYTLLDLSINSCYLHSFRRKDNKVEADNKRRRTAHEARVHAFLFMLLEKEFDMKALPPSGSSEDFLTVSENP